MFIVFSTMRFSRTIFFVLSLLLLVYAGCSTSESNEAQTETLPLFQNVSLDAGFVGDAACADCHEDEYAGYQEHGMANSMYRLTSDNLVEDIGSEVVVDSLTGLHYITEASDSGYVMIEYLLNEDGNRVHQLKRPMDWVVGSGTSARTYLSEKDGWFYELPVTWYTQKGTWDFSPGYRIANKRFDRKINDRCVVCHNSYPIPVEQTSGMYEEMPSGIGCERCHGPGALHVEERLISPEADSEIDYSIINPAHLDLDLRLDVCQQCHLNGDVSLLRTGRTPYDFRPTQHLEDYVALFTPTHDIQDESSIGVISHADRMMLSACFTETMTLDRPLECTTCHDPHAGFRTQGPEYFNATCLDCHDANQLPTKPQLADGSPLHTAQANCIDCHMPKTDIIEAPHSAFTDHWIRTISSEESPITAQTSERLDAHYARDRSESDQAFMYRAMASITLGNRTSNTNLLKFGMDGLEAARSSGYASGEALYLLGYAYLQLSQYEAAIGPLEEAAREDGSIAERLNGLAQAYEGAAQNRAKIEPLYREALRIQPSLTDVRLNYGRFLETQNRIDEAKTQYQRVIQDESWNELGYYNLGTALLREGNTAEAEPMLREAIALNPFHAESFNNLALLLLNAGRDEEGEQVFSEALSRLPNSLQLLSNYGSYLLNAERLEESIDVYSKATQLDPSNAEYHAMKALAYFRSDQFEDAEQAAREAIRLDSSNQLAAQILSAL